jgi:hypothetical protein
MMVAFDPWLHHARAPECNPRIELCRVSDPTWLPDGPHSQHRSGGPLGNRLVVAASTSANTLSPLTMTVITGIPGGGALKIT